MSCTLQTIQRHIFHGIPQIEYWYFLWNWNSILKSQLKTDVKDRHLKYSIFIIRDLKKYIVTLYWLDNFGNFSAHLVLPGIIQRWEKQKLNSWRHIDIVSTFGLTRRSNRWNRSQSTDVKFIQLNSQNDYHPTSTYIFNVDRNNCKQNKNKNFSIYLCFRWLSMEFQIFLDRFAHCSSLQLAEEQLIPGRLVH